MDLDFSSSLPDTGSSISVPGLDSEVTILRDRYGIPHIRAKHNNDAFFGQGFATAQDRFCLLYTSPSTRDLSTSRMPSSA